MDELLSTNRRRPWWHVGHRILRQPVAPLYPEGASYCTGCKEWQSAYEEHRYEGQVYASKATCQKCGQVITYSVYDGGGTSRQLTRARAWATERGERNAEIR